VVSEVAIGEGEEEEVAEEMEREVEEVEEEVAEEMAAVVEIGILNVWMKIGTGTCIKEDKTCPKEGKPLAVEKTIENPE